jgi:hypothetical protein
MRGGRWADLVDVEDDPDAEAGPDPEREWGPRHSRSGEQTRVSRAERAAQRRVRAAATAPAHVRFVQRLQHQRTCVAALQAQLHLQNQLLVAQSALARHEDRLASTSCISSAGAALLQGDGPSLASLAQTGDAPAPLKVGGAQPAGYSYLGLNQGVPIWGHEDIVRAALRADGDRVCPE